MPEYYQGPRDASVQWGQTFHNTFFQVMAELGSLGLITYFLMLTIVWIYLSKIQKAQKERDNNLTYLLVLSLKGGIIAFVISGAFLSTAYYPQLWTLYTLAITLQIYHKQRQTYIKNDQI
jgi:amino acid transporter